MEDHVRTGANGDANTSLDLVVLVTISLSVKRFSQLADTEIGERTNEKTLKKTNIYSTPHPCVYSITKSIKRKKEVYILKKALYNDRNESLDQYKYPLSKSR